MSWQIFNYCPEGSWFGPASQEMQQLWRERRGEYIPYKYAGYIQRVVLEDVPDDALTQRIQKSLRIGAYQLPE